MIKILKVIAIIALIALIGIQFIPTTRNQSDILPATDFIATYNPPKEVERIFRTSCYDCHSNNTEYPWYNKIQPVAMYLEEHIEHGKEEFNFNEFGDYSERRKKSKLKSLLKEVEQGKMPLESYTLIHRDSKISESEEKLVLDWVNKILDGI